MGSLFPSSKQIAFASSLGISVASSVTTRQLSMLIDKALEEQKRVNDERVQQARDIDMLTLVSSYTEMTKQSWRYHCGPCPMTGCQAAEDGFVVDTHHNSWFCRKCGDKGTPIGFLMEKENLSFWEAVTELVGESYVPLVPCTRRVPVKKTEAVFLWGKDKWQQEAQRMVWTSSQRLMGVGVDAHLARHPSDHSLSKSLYPSDRQQPVGHVDAHLAQNYLIAERAISLATARAWRLGQARVRFKVGKGKEEANAIIIPWMGPDGLIKAIQYRLIGGASRRFHSKYGGQKTIYGAHLLAPSRDKILFIVEGEFNAISIWQEAHRADLPIDVISIGGEGIGDERLSKLVKLVARYQGCVAWLDRDEVAKRVGNHLTYAMLVSSPGGHDANRLAQSGELATIVKAIYEGYVCGNVPVVAKPALAVVTTPAEQEQEIYDLLHDAGCAMEGFHGDAEAQGDRLYRQLEDTLDSYDIEAALRIHAQIKSLASLQTWPDLANSIKEEDKQKYNALHL